MKHIITALFTLCLFGRLQQLQAQEENLLIDRIVAVVGDRIILQSDLEIQYQQAKAQDPTVPDDYRCTVLDQLLLEKLFITAATVDSLTVGEEELEAELDGRINYFVSLFGGADAMESYYGKSLAAIKEEFRDNVREQLLARKMQAEVLADINVTPAEVKEYFNKIPADSLPYFNAEVELGELVAVAKLTRQQKAETRKTLLEIKDKILNEGKDFANLASAYSEDPGSATNGGDLGWVQRGQFVPEFEAAAYKLRPGELSDIVETQFGMHLIQLIERRGDRINCRHILIKPEVSGEQMQMAYNKLDSIRNLIQNDTLTFRQATAKFSDKDENKNNGGQILNRQAGSALFEMDELEPTVYFAIENLKEGEVSEPVEYEDEEGNKGYRLLYVYSRSQPHLANLGEDYNRIQQMAQNRKQMQVMNDWLERRIPETYIKIEPEYHNCGPVVNWVR